MELTLAEQFFFLAQHPTSYYSVIGTTQRSVGLTGALILQLFEKKAFTIKDSKLALTPTSEELNEIEKLVLDRIKQSKKSRKIKSWIHRLYPKSDPWKKAIMQQLTDKGLFRIQHKKFLFIPYTRVYIENTAFHDQFAEHMKKALENPQSLSTKELQLLSLIKATKMYKGLSRDKKEWKAIRKQLKELEIKNLVSGEISETIQEIEAAVIVSIMASTAAVAATTATTSSTSS